MLELITVHERRLTALRLEYLYLLRSLVSDLNSGLKGLRRGIVLR